MPQQELNLTGVPQETSLDKPVTDAEVSLAELAANWMTIVRSKFKTSVELAAAEVKLAAMSFVFMTFLAVALAILALSGWGLLLAGMVVGLLDAGMALWTILLAAALVHMVLAFIALRTIVGLSRHLKLTGARRSAEGRDSSPGSNDAD